MSKSKFTIKVYSKITGSKILDISLSNLLCKYLNRGRKSISYEVIEHATFKTETSVK